MLKQVRKKYRKDGLLSLVKTAIQFGYNNYIRSSLPRGVVQYNSIPVKACRIGDSLIPWQSKDIPGYEDAIIEGLNRFVEVDDTVVIVGGGWGISTVVAANNVDDQGRVITYEGGSETVQNVQNTVDLNNVGERVSIHHAVVGQAISLRDDRSNAGAVSPADLPKCDVLVLDCEGAEIDILSEMVIQPRVIIVETHGMYDAPEARVRDRLAQSGYYIVKSMVAEERLKYTCEKNGIYVLFALNEELNT